jgi:hypothetical protein
MQLLVFVTDDASPEGSGPTLFVAAEPGAMLPLNPRTLSWRYLATIDERDRIFDVHGRDAKQAIRSRGFFISNRLPVAVEAKGAELRREPGSAIVGSDSSPARQR